MLNKNVNNTEDLINQIKENDIMINKELETPIVSSLDNLEKNINDADLEIQNTIKQKIEDSSEKNKNTKPVITSQSLYEEFKKKKKRKRRKKFY